jgi:DNA-binding response OmpR family regulator
VVTGPDRLAVLVEDHPMVRRLVGELLEIEGFRVQSFAAATPAAEFLRAGQPDLVVLDWLLPDAPGEWLLEQVLEHSAGARCLVVSGQKLERQGPLANERVRLLEKPFTPPALRGVIQELLPL